MRPSPSLNGRSSAVTTTTSTGSISPRTRSTAITLRTRTGDEAAYRPHTRVRRVRPGESGGADALCVREVQDGPAQVLLRLRPRGGDPALAYGMEAHLRR